MNEPMFIPNDRAALHLQVDSDVAAASCEGVNPLRSTRHLRAGFVGVAALLGLSAWALRPLAARTDLQSSVSEKSSLSGVVAAFSPSAVDLKMQPGSFQGHVRPSYPAQRPVVSALRPRTPISTLRMNADNDGNPTGSLVNDDSTRRRLRKRIMNKLRSFVWDKTEQDGIEGDATRRRLRKRIKTRVKKWWQGGRVEEYAEKLNQGEAKEGASQKAADFSMVGSEPTSFGQLRGPLYVQRMAEARVPALTVADSSLEWFCVNDIVMGGQSSSFVKRTADASLQFSGTISTTGGGFASCRTARGTFPVPATATGVSLEVRGMPTHYFKFAMSADTRAEGEVSVLRGETADTRGFNARWQSMSPEQRNETLQRVQWQQQIPLKRISGLQKRSGMQKVFLPFADFKPSFFGQALTGLTLVHETCSQFGITVGVFDVQGGIDTGYSDGPFDLEVASIEFA